MAQLNNVKFIRITIPTRDILRTLAKPSSLKFQYSFGLIEKYTVTRSEHSRNSVEHFQNSPTNTKGSLLTRIVVGARKYLGARKNRGTRGKGKSLACPVLSCTHYSQVPAMQASSLPQSKYLLKLQEAFVKAVAQQNQHKLHF